MRSVELAGAGIAGAVLDGVGQIFQRDVADRHCRRISLNANGGLRSVHRNLADAGQDAEPLADLRIGVVVELAFGLRVADQHQVHDRLIVGVGLGERWRAGQIDGELSRGAGDGRLNISRGRVQTLGKIELQHEVGVALRIVRGHQLEAGNLHELALQRRGDVVRHSLWRRAGIVHLHLDHRVIHRGQVAYRQLKVGYQSEQNDGDAERNRHDRTANEEFREIHDCAPAVPLVLEFAFEAGCEAGCAADAAATRTLPPGRTNSWPVSTTCSLAAMPLVITT